jgi:hypothetical protein
MVDPAEADNVTVRQLKWNAAQKRQNQRDKRRWGKKRTQKEETAERWRKHNQAIGRKRSRVDPYEPKHNGKKYMQYRKNGKGWKKNHPKNPHYWP